MQILKCFNWVLKVWYCWKTLLPFQYLRKYRILQRPCSIFFWKLDGSLTRYKDGGGLFFRPNSLTVVDISQYMEEMHGDCVVLAMLCFSYTCLMAITEPPCWLRVREIDTVEVEIRPCSASPQIYRWLVVVVLVPQPWEVTAIDTKTWEGGDYWVFINVQAVKTTILQAVYTVKKNLQELVEWFRCRFWERMIGEKIYVVYAGCSKSDVKIWMLLGLAFLRKKLENSSSQFHLPHNFMHASKYNEFSSILLLAFLSFLFFEYLI